MERDRMGRVNVHVCRLLCFDKEGNQRKILCKGSVSKFDVITWADYERKVWECSEPGNRCKALFDSSWMDVSLIDAYIKEVEK